VNKLNQKITAQKFKADPASDIRTVLQKIQQIQLNEDVTLGGKPPVVTGTKTPDLPSNIGEPTGRMVQNFNQDWYEFKNGNTSTWLGNYWGEVAAGQTLDMINRKLNTPAFQGIYEPNNTNKSLAARVLALRQKLQTIPPGQGIEGQDIDKIETQPSWGVGNPKPSYNEDVTLGGKPPVVTGTKTPDLPSNIGEPTGRMIPFFGQDWYEFNTKSGKTVYLGNYWGEVAAGQTLDAINRLQGAARTSDGNKEAAKRVLALRQKLSSIPPGQGIEGQDIDKIETQPSGGSLNETAKDSINIMRRLIDSI